MSEPSDATTSARYTGLVERYRARLPLQPATRPVSLCEGRTPLLSLDTLAASVGGEVEIHAKFEGLNPTGSFKDRGMTMAVTRAAELGARAIVCASTGNTSASAAAYAARAGMKAFVLIPDGKIAMGKLAQAMMHGAEIIKIRGNFDDGMNIVKGIADCAPVELVNSVNPYRLQGQKTVAFEVVESLGRAPDYHCLPVGNAGNISAHWLGYCEYGPPGDNLLCTAMRQAHGLDGYEVSQVTGSRPVMVGYQASGAAPFLRGEPVSAPETVATAIRIGNPQSWSYAESAVAESGGWFDELTDEEILATQRALAEHEGVFCEPASAASVCGALKDVRAGRIPPGSTVVCTVTGHGLKDPDCAISQCAQPAVAIAATLDAVRSTILDAL